LHLWRLCPTAAVTTPYIIIENSNRIATVVR